MYSYVSALVRYEYLAGLQTLITELVYKAWRNQSRVPVNARSCKHLRSILGDAYENERVKVMNPDGTSSSGKKGKAQSTKSRSKRKRNDDDDDGEDNNGDKKRARPSKKPSPKANNEQQDPDDEDDEDEDPPSSSKKKVEVLLAVKWDLDKGADPSGWWVSEKLDGVRYVCS